MTVDCVFQIKIQSKKVSQSLIGSQGKFMKLNLTKIKPAFDISMPKLCTLFLCVVFTVNGQNQCMPSASNDGIFVGTSSLTSGMIKPGINSYSVAPGVLQSLSPSGLIYEPTKLQISHSFKNFISSSPNNGYEMTDFSFHSLVVNGTQIRFLFLWNEVNTINISISLSFQFLLVYGREEFLMGSFVIDTVQFILKNVSGMNQLNFSRVVPFKDYSPTIKMPNQFSMMSVNLFIVGMRYLGKNVSLKIGNEIYDKNSSQLSFSINLNNSNSLYLVHLSYVIFDKTYLSSEFKMFFSWNELANQSKIDYWIKGVKQINFKGFQTGNILVGDFYMYKINRLKCMQSCQSCISNQNCQKSNGTIFNDSQCFVCPSASIFNSSTLKCQYLSSCSVNQVQSNNQCICKPGFVRIGSQCGICPLNSVYNSSTKLCDIKCSENETLSNGQCVCKLGFYIVQGKCSKCGDGFSYDKVYKKCIGLCSAVEVYNSVNKSCECINGLYRIGNKCGKCSPGYIYNSSTFSCMLVCGQNKVIINSKCQCLPDFVLIQGNCSKCLSGTIYNSLTQSCQSICTGNRRILNGKCVCNDGLYEIGNQCGVCPSGSIYDSYLKNCIFTSNCKQNQIIVNNTCTCNGPYVSSICQPCPSSLVWNTTLNQCILNCPKNSYYNSFIKACVCNNGFYVIGDKCDICPSGTVYDFASKTCQNGQNCTGLHEIFYLGLCICDAGYLRIKGSCGVCSQGTKYDETLFDCLTICGLNQIYNNTTATCQCNQVSGYYRINGFCQTCPTGSSYNKLTQKCEITCPSGQININGICQCPVGYFLIGNTCGLCDIGTVYNSTALKCDKICPDPNGYYQNGRCFCYPPYVVVNTNQCKQCVNGSVYDLASLSCKNTTINPQNNNLTCNITSQIRVLNETSGQYYCACDQANKYYLIYDRCGTCQIFTKYNADSKSCQLDTSYLVSNVVNYYPNYIPFTVGGNTTIVNNTVNNNATNSFNISTNCSFKDNRVIINGLCKCISTAILINNTCLICPSNSLPDSQQTTCLCNIGYSLNANNTCTKTNTSLTNTSSTPIKVNSDPTCSTNQVWNRTECICVENYYKIDKICTKCPQLSYFNGSTCTCQYGYYAQALTSSKLPTSCIKCHSSCATCSGPNQNQCLSCSNISHILSNGTCIPLSCDIGYFPQISSSKSQCQKCSSYCASCTSSISCNKCIDGFFIQNLNITQSLTIQVCSQICGDGKRFQANCDDNNKIQGDGCNKNCQIESGWTCIGGTSTSKDTCSIIDPLTKSIISITSTTISKGTIIQNVRLSYLPDYFLKTQCSQCNKVLKVTVTQAKILPDTIKVNFIQKSKYQFNIQFKFNDILSIPPFKFGVQLNPEYKNYFSVWDMNQFYEAQIDPAHLSLKTPEDYLRIDDLLA